MFRSLRLMHACSVSFNRVVLLHTAASSVEHHGVQPTDYMDNEPEPSHGILRNDLPQNTEQFRIGPTLSCAPGRRQDRVSSVSSPRTQEVPRHLLTCSHPTPWCDQVSLQEVPRHLLTCSHPHPLV